MARTALTFSPFTYNAAISDPAGVAVDQANGNVVVANALERTWLRVKNTSGGALNVIIRKGTPSLAIASGQGDLTISVGAGATSFLGPFESGRFGQADTGAGQMGLNIDYQAGFTGTITTFNFPWH